MNHIQIGDKAKYTIAQANGTTEEVHGRIKRIDGPTALIDIGRSQTTIDLTILTKTKDYEPPE